MIEAYVDDNFTNLTPLGRIISNNVNTHNIKNTRTMPEFEALIDKDKSAFEVGLHKYLKLIIYFINFILLTDT